MAKPSQKALKLPATSPDRMFRGRAALARRPSRPSLTWVDSVEVKIFTSSGMMAPASVPHVTTVD